jgi:hypothetical protein
MKQFLELRDNPQNERKFLQSIHQRIYSEYIKSSKIKHKEKK